MILVFGGNDHKFDENIARWVFSTIGQADRLLHAGEYYAIGVVCRGDVTAGVVYHDYAKSTAPGVGGKMQVTFASKSPSWAHPRIIGALLAYPFRTVGCHVLIATVRRNNRRCRDLVIGLGFTERGTVPNFPNSEDDVIYTLRREVAEARWIEPPKRRAA